MTVNKRSKLSRQRGQWTHGWGAKKKHRGAGHRGGRGNAGSGKRGDAKKPSFWKNTKPGRYGFTSHSRTQIVAINVAYLDQHAESLCTKEKDLYVVDLEQIGYNKLLGTGKVTKKFKITTPYATPSAIQKITDAKGEVLGLLSEEVSSVSAEEADE